MKNKPNTLSNDLLHELKLTKTDPSISLYMPTHRSHPANLQDAILYKNLVKQVKELLQSEFSEHEVQHFLDPFEELAQDKELWNKTLDGLAIFSAKNYFKFFFLQQPLVSVVKVSDTFHTEPLAEYAQSMGRFHILSLTRDRVQLYEGNRYTVSEIELQPEIPKTITEALGEDLTDKHSTVASYGGTGMQTSCMHHGDGGRKDQIDNDIERFFRIISQAIQEHYSQPTGLPLILAALPEHHHLFHKVSKNPLLQKDGISASPHTLTPEKLAEAAFDLIQHNNV